MFKPLLAPREDPLSYPNYFKELRFPLMGSPKLDGIRNIVKYGRCKSRTFKDIPSRQAQKLFSDYEHFDGELIEGNLSDVDVYNRTQSYIMSELKEGDITFNVFDYTHPDWLHKSFYKRLDEIERLCREAQDPGLRFIHHESRRIVTF
jgi:DNA ligase 1